MAAYTTIDDPSAFFKCQLYTGTGSSNAITFNDTDTDMQPDLVWCKQRSSPAASSALVNSVTGVDKFMASNASTAEVDDAYNVTAFGSDGFTVGASSGSADINVSSETYVAWCWKESATAGFDIVAMEGTGSARTQAHSLSAIPHWMTVKSRDDNDNWFVYHRGNTSAPETDKLKLDETGGTADDNTIWNDTAPTSSVFTVGTTNGVNKDDSDFVAYLWAEKQGFSKFSKYTGFGNAENVFVYCGFRPAFILLKQSSGAGEDWIIYDEHREPYNGDVNRLRASANSVESSDSYIDITSTGFKCRTTDGTVSGNGDVHIFMAFADSPIVNSEGVPNNAR